MGNHSTKSQNISRDHRPKKNVHWKSAEPPSNPGKPIQITDYNAPADAVVIKWDRPYTDGGSPIMGYLVEQRRVGSPTWVKTSATLVPYQEITLTGIDPTWRYQFRVFAQNVVGISESSPISDIISAISQRSGTAAPQFLNELENATVLENDQCEFHVSVIGSPTPQINWFKDGFEIFSSRRTKIINDHDSSTLIFHQIALTDEGEIKCTATNRYGHVVTRFQLRIDAPPKIRLPRQYEDGYLVEAGEIIKLKVGLAGRPTPGICWSHNGDVIKNGGRYEITTNDKNSFLKITKATRKDRGEYNVRAINKLGEFNASFLVTVTAKPSPPQNVRISMSLGKSVTLTWNTPEDDGGCKIGNYVVEYFRIGWDVWLKASSTRQLTATLNDLIEGSEYKFRVKAESPYGLSEPSEESKTLFIPDPKRGIVTPAKVSTLSPNADRKHLINQQYNQDRKSPIKQIIIPDLPKNVEFISQIYDNEQIVKELNYGTSVENRTKKKESISNTTPKLNPNSIRHTENHANKKSVKSEPDSMASRITSSPQANKNESRAHGKTRNQGDEKNTLSPAHDEVHTSNEYMLVLYDDKKSGKQNEEKNHFDLDLKEAIDAPPLSLSTPDLSDMSHHSTFQPLRRSASSSELLYEKVMQRFYEAVELDEAEMARKQGDSGQNKKSKFVEHMEDDNEFISRTNEAKPEIKSDQSHEWKNEDDRDLRKEIYESQRKRSHRPHEPSTDIVYDDDYTESTASSVGSISISASIESIEQFINSVRSASTNTSTTAINTRTSVNDELETYHPSMEVRALSPYRTPDPGQATIELNRPIALPNPDIKPKSILKRRTSNENGMNEAIVTQTIVENKENLQKEKKPSQKQTESQPPSPIPLHPSHLQSKPQPKPQPQPEKEPEPKSLPSTPKPEKEKRSFLNLFSKKQATSAENLKKPIESPVEKVLPEKATEKEKLSKLRQNSIEENKVEQVAVIDHYSDIVKELGGNQKTKASIPLYMNHHALREAAARAELEEREQLLAKQTNEMHKININDDVDDMSELAKKMNLYTDANENSVERETVSPPPSSSPNDLVEISVEHTQSVSYALRQIKQPDVCRTNNETMVEANAKCLTESTKLCNEDDGIDSVIDTKKQETLTKVRSSSRSRQLGRKSISERRSQSKSPVSERMTSVSNTVLKVTRMPIQNDIDIELEPSEQSPSPELPESRCITPEQMQTTAELKIRSTLSYATDLFLFLFACYLYIFRDAYLLTIPILILMVCRHVINLLIDKWQKWTTLDKRKTE
ncbi:muscle M-line assembly protein unc-89 [Contarinia nasturtii]|uniref:muscle M-line assembly protein unc-89 n=1 Tax=Contarinia nasturtii TaxID=265458 RepID=UPI0012D42776|nr:muscle M-line assembly protein unc-89 [Contarinia nasturtii]